MKLNRLLKYIKTNHQELLFFLCLLLFSTWLAFHTFSYKDGNMLIAGKAWSDFGSHIPLIRSFSLGFNFPIEYPIFPGEPIRYHFLFYAAVGLLERIGLRIDFALNILSALSFFALLLTIYYLTKLLVKSTSAAVIAVIFFLFNSSLSFLEFFKLHPLSPNTLRDVVTNSTFPSFGPYDGKIVSAFLNLNIYTNQRHFPLSIAILLLFVMYVVQKSDAKQTTRIGSILLWAFLIGLMPYLHSGIFICLFIVGGILFLLLKHVRKEIFFSFLLGGLLALPRLLLLQSGASDELQLHFGYLAEAENLQSIATYWLFNLGLSLILIPVGFLLAPRSAKKVFVAFFALFLIGNTIQFSPEIAANHKFITVFIIVGNIFTALALVKLWKIKILGKIFVPILFFLLILSGIIDFFPILNDGKLELTDYPKDQTVSWIKNTTPQDAVFLNTNYTFNKASLAGRDIFLGWPYFSWSQGYETTQRGETMRQMLGATEKTSVCTLLKRHNIDYIEVDAKSIDDPNIPPVSTIFADEFFLIYATPEQKYAIYSVEKSCG